jgi:hypothetical protein
MDGFDGNRRVFGSDTLKALDALIQNGDWCRIIPHRIETSW